ncbi:MAG: efflux RND transporter permease subunit [Bacillus subtilis]|nr:efflux RND transporter permease subunit [Bacillus subtilis]
MPQVYADIDREQGAEARGADLRRQHDARRPARQLLRQRLQPVRPRLQGLRPGRARVPRPTRSSSACSSCAARRATWCRSTRWCRRGRRPGPSSRTGSTCTAPRRSRGVPAAGLQLGAGAGRPRGGRGRRCCRPTWATSGRTCRTRRRRAPSPGPTFAVAILLVFLVLAAQYESWSLPFSVLLGTPFAAFGAYFGLWARAPALGRAT